MKRSSCSLRSISEYLRPWKLVSLTGGIALLLAGSMLTPMPDWDVGISLLMALLTYVLAPLSAGVVRNKQWHRLPVAVFWAWVCVDGAYWAYWQSQNPSALEMRPFQWPLSLAMYCACGALWSYEGTFSALRQTVKNWARGRALR